MTSSGHGIYDEGGKALRMVGIVIDVTAAHTGEGSPTVS